MHILPAGLIRAIYLTLAHSLWQGALLALLAVLILATTRRSAPAKRYNLLLGAFSLFAVSGLVTFLLLLDRHGHSSSLTVTIQEGEAAVWSDRVDHGLQLLTSPAPVADIISFLDRHSGTLVMAWLGVILLRCLQLSVGLAGLRRLRYRSVAVTDQRWLQYLEHTSAALGIRRVVQFAETAAAKVPLAIGYFKPLILVPAGLLAALPPAELEAILAHELAHIRRRDYLVNLLQSLVETCYFFNPAAWWVSALIRAEREHCCDDKAVALSGGKRNYIQALAACQEYYLSTPAYAMAFAGRQRSLSERVRRLIHGGRRAVGRTEKLTFSVCLLIVVLLCAVYLRPAHALRTPQETTVSHTTETIEMTETTEATAETVADWPSTRSDVCKPSAAAEADTPGRSMPAPPAAPAKTAVPAVPAAPRAPSSAGAPPAPPAPPASPSAGTPPAPPAEPPVADILIDRMVKDGLIKAEASSMRFSLSDRRMEINGVQQPPAVHRKYKNLYETTTDKKGNWKISVAQDRN